MERLAQESLSGEGVSVSNPAMKRPSYSAVEMSIWTPPPPLGDEAGKAARFDADVSHPLGWSVDPV